MAYPTVSAPYGFQAINRVDGMPYAGAIRQIPIASGYTTAIYNGDPVIIVAGGTIERSAASGAVTTGSPVGVLVGCAYTNSSGYYSFSRTTVAGDQFTIQLTAPTVIQAILLSDAQSVSDIALGKTTKTGLTFQIYDVNNDSKITVTDEYYVFGRKSGRFSSWKNIPDNRFYTSTEYNNLKSATTNVRTTYPGVSSITTSTLTSGGSLSYYLIAPGSLSFSELHTSFDSKQLSELDSSY
jgi:hypothetical protein